MKQVYSEEELAAGCQGKNPLHQQALYQVYSGRMLGVCMRYASSKTEAEDILQDAFVRIFERISSFRGEGSLEGWVRRVVVRTALEHCRRKAIRRTEDLTEVKGREVSPDQLAALSRDELLSLIQALPEGYRMVFNLYAIEGYSHKEIADSLGISQGGSKSQLSRARIWLQKRLKAMEWSRETLSA